MVSGFPWPVFSSGGTGELAGKARMVSGLGFKKAFSLAQVRLLIADLAGDTVRFAITVAVFGFAVVV